MADASPPPPERTMPLVELRKEHPQGTLVLAHPERLGSVAEWILNGFAKTPLEDGQTTRLGNVPISIRRRDSEWWLCEPDLDSRAVRCWDLYDAMTVFVLREKIHEAAGVPPARFPMRGMVLCFRDSIADAQIFLRRDEPEPGDVDTGWYLQVHAQVPDEEANDRRNLRPMSVYQIYTQRPALIAALGLPVGWIAIFDKHTLLAVADPTNRVVLDTTLPTPS